MSKLFKKSEEPIQPIEKELMLDNPEEVEKWGPSQEGQAEYKPSLNDIEKELLEEARMNPLQETIRREHAANPDRRELLKEERRLGLQPDKKFISVRVTSASTLTRDMARSSNALCVLCVRAACCRTRARPASTSRRSSIRAARCTCQWPARPTLSSPSRGTNRRSEDAHVHIAEEAARRKWGRAGGWVGVADWLHAPR
jgi:hypothetical protein